MRSEEKAPASSIQSPPGRKSRQNNDDRRNEEGRSQHPQSFQVNRALVKVAPTVSGQKTIPGAPQAKAYANCFWLHPNCYLLLTMEKQQGMCPEKTACCQRTESLLQRILILRSKHTTIENYPKPSFTKLGIHSTMDEETLNSEAKQILLPRQFQKQGPNETINSCDTDFSSHQWNSLTDTAT